MPPLPRWWLRDARSLGYAGRWRKRVPRPVRVGIGDSVSPDPDDSEVPRHGRVAAATERARREAENARLWAEDARQRSSLVAFGFDFYARDRQRFGGLLAGAVAFRLFLWLVPFVLLLVGVLGAVTDIEGGTPGSISDSLGLQGALAETVSDSARQRGWWIAIVLGLFGTVWAGMGVVRAMRVSHSAAWGVPPDRARNALLASGLLSGGVIGLLLLSFIVGWIRHNTGVIGLLAALALLAVYFVGWLALSIWLPHRPVAVKALVPGALLVAVGVELLHLFTTYYLTDRAARAASVYGAIGTALVILLWLYLLARLMVGAAVLNAELAARRERED